MPTDHHLFLNSLRGSPKDGSLNPLKGSTCSSVFNLHLTDKQTENVRSYFFKVTRMVSGSRNKPEKFAEMPSM